MFSQCDYQVLQPCETAGQAEKRRRGRTGVGVVGERERTLSLGDEMLVLLVVLIENNTAC